MLRIFNIWVYRCMLSHSSLLSLNCTMISTRKLTMGNFISKFSFGSNEIRTSDLRITSPCFSLISGSVCCCQIHCTRIPPNSKHLCLRRKMWLRPIKCRTFPAFCIKQSNPPTGISPQRWCIFSMYHGNLQHDIRAFEINSPSVKYICYIPF